MPPSEKASKGIVMTDLLEKQRPREELDVAWFGGIVKKRARKFHGFSTPHQSPE